VADVAVERLFDVVVAEDVLPKVLHRWGPIPGVAGTRDNTGPWDQPGSERTVVLEDGNTGRERVLDWVRPSRFEYRVDAFTGAFGRVVDHAIGSWEFTDTGRGSAFRWTYTFTARGLVGAALLAAGVPLAWARYMEQCAAECARLAAES
jgi:Polyketide cyclase / dehydrase and lipid transport